MRHGTIAKPLGKIFNHFDETYNKIEMVANKIFKHLDKIKTPISLAGLSLMILYLIISSILKLDIFDKVNSNQTFELINKIINYVFYISILTIILGVTSYVITILRKKKAKLKLIDVSKDKSVSEEVCKAILGDFEFKDRKISNGNFSESIDFKFINKGDGSAFLTKVEIEVIESKLNESPNLDFSYSIRKNNLIIKANNKGWGKATIKKIHIKNNLLNQFINIHKLTSIEIESKNEVVLQELCSGLNSKLLNAEYEQNLLKRKEFIRMVHSHMLSQNNEILKSKDFQKLFSNHEIWHIREFFENLESDGLDNRQKWHIDYFQSELLDAIPINDDIYIEVTYLDNIKNEFIETFHVKSPHIEGGWLWWSTSGFIFEPRVVMYKLMPPETIYSVILSPDQNKSSKLYPLSHYIKSQEPERFHFHFVSEKSASYKLRFHFSFNKKQTISSEPIFLDLITENQDNVLNNFKDGQILTYEDGEVKLK